jgi:hypothetical protein
MERAGRLIGKLQLPKGTIDPESMARSAWPAAVGKRIAARTRAVKLVRSALVVECEDSTWQRQLNTLSWQILRNLNTMLGEGVVTSIDLRPVPPRRGMQSAESARPFELGAPLRPLQQQKATGDEADRIQDPVFRMLYKQSRKKAAGQQASLLFEENRKASA